MNVKRYYPRLVHAIWPMLLLLLWLPACKKKSMEPTSGELDPTTHFTDEYLASVRNYLNFDDQTDKYFATFGHKRDLDNAEGNIFETIGGKETIIYNTKAFAFCKDSAMLGFYPMTVNPSLWRQSYLNQLSGLFELQRDAVYQIRGFDLANMSIVKDGDGNWIVIDPMGSPGTAKAGIELFNDYMLDESLATAPILISTIIFTHSHLDHFGGVEGLKDFLMNNHKVYAPKGFMEEAVAENVMAGNCMGRRATYMYGNLLKKDTLGTLGSGLGTVTSTGIAGIKEPAIEITDDNNGETLMVANRKIVFWNAPSSEAPAEMIFYFPDFKAMCQAEDMNHTLHNLITLRGAKVRNGLKWSKYIDKAIELWGDDVQLSFGSHHWPIFNTTDAGPHAISVKEFWEDQRDLYRFIHDQTLRLANQGLTMNELAEVIHLPTKLDKRFHSRGYYGTMSHDIKAQYQLYFGWFDGNPANLNPLPPREAGNAYVKYVGPKVMNDAAQAAFDEGNYRFAAELWNKLVFSDKCTPGHRESLAKTYEQMGYQAESGPWRNFYLTGAKELRGGVTKGPAPAAATPAIIENMSTELLLDYLAMKFKGTEEAAGKMDVDFNLFINKVGKDQEEACLIVSNGAVSVRIGNHISSGCSVEMDRDAINKELIAGKSLADMVTDGAITIPDPTCKSNFETFASYIDKFEFWFEIVTGTHAVPY